MQMYNAAVGVGTRRVGTAVNEKDSSTTSTSDGGASRVDGVKRLSSCMIGLAAAGML